MRKHRKSKFKLISCGLVLLTVTTLASWAMGKADSRMDQQAPTSRSSSSSSQAASSSTITSVSGNSDQKTVASASEQVPVVSSSAFVQEVPAVTTPAISGMQLAQVIAEDFSSMEGVWVNGDGQTLTFGVAGLTGGQGRVQGFKDTGYGTARGYFFAENFGGGTMELLPAGTVFPDFTYDREGEETTAADSSDKQQDRIWMGHDIVSIAEPSSFYYRANR